MLIYILIVLSYNTLTGWIAGYREVESLIRDKSWKSEWLKIYFWKNLKIFGKEIPNTDSYHFMGGLRKLFNVLAFVIEIFWITMYGYLLIEVLFFIDPGNLFTAILIAILHILIYWGYWYWQRNIFMHILSRRPEFREYKYLSPFQLKAKKKEANKIKLNERQSQILYHIEKHNGIYEYEIYNVSLFSNRETSAILNELYKSKMITTDKQRLFITDDGIDYLER